MGPTDPEKAKEEQPEWFGHLLLCFLSMSQACYSLRALFGADLTKNAVHGSSDPLRAKDAIKMIFGDIQLDTVLSKSPSAGQFVSVTILFQYGHTEGNTATDGDNATTTPGK